MREKLQVLEGLGIGDQVNACGLLKGVLREATAEVLGETLGLQSWQQGQKHHAYLQPLLLPGAATAIWFRMPLLGSSSVYLAFTYLGLDIYSQWLG